MSVYDDKSWIQGDLYAIEAAVAHHGNKELAKFVGEKLVTLRRLCPKIEGDLYDELIAVRLYHAANQVLLEKLAEKNPRVAIHQSDIVKAYRNPRVRVHVEGEYSIFSLEAEEPVERVRRFSQALKKRGRKRILDTYRTHALKCYSLALSLKTGLYRFLPLLS